jgi:pantoate--beta-alanine ligase
VRIEVVPTVREDTGLALSSRNQNLDEPARTAARSLSVGLAAAAAAAHSGVPAAIVAAHAVIGAAPLVKLDYLVVVHPRTYLPVDDDYRGQARMLVAAVVGSTRLIDNISLDIP